jgi:hypothetical protein
MAKLFYPYNRIINGEALSKVINLESSGKDRTRVIKAILFAIRELMSQSEPSDETRDIVAFISMSQYAVYRTIEPSLAAWEKRGYWVKADKFRLEWEWTEKSSKELKTALVANDWGRIAMLIAQIGQKFAHVKIPIKNTLGTPWVGAWQVLKQKGSGD